MAHLAAQLGRVNSSLATLSQSCSGDDDALRRARATLAQIIGRAAAAPSGHKHRAIRVANPAFQKRVGRFNGGTDVLCAAGFQETAQGTLELQGDNFGPTSQGGAYLALVVSLLNGPVLSAVSSTQDSSSNIGGEGKSSSPAEEQNKGTGPAAFASALKRIRAAAFDEDSRVAVPLLMKIIRRAVLSPGHKHRSIKLDNEVFKWRLGRIDGGVDALIAVGFELQAGGSVLAFVGQGPAKLNQREILECFSQLQEFARSLNMAASDLPRPLTQVEYDAVTPAEYPTGLLFLVPSFLLIV